MQYRFTIEEYEKDTDRWVRSVNAYCRQKTAESVCDQLNAEADFMKSGKRYEVCEA